MNKKPNSPPTAPPTKVLLHTSLIYIQNFGKNGQLVRLNF